LVAINGNNAMINFYPPTLCINLSIAFSAALVGDALLSLLSVVASLRERAHGGSNDCEVRDNLGEVHLGQKDGG
jgi:hypothetical protein